MRDYIGKLLQVQGVRNASPPCGRFEIKDIEFRLLIITRNMSIALI